MGMTPASSDVTDDEPFAIAERPPDTDGDYVRFEATVHPGLDAGTADDSEATDGTAPPDDTEAPEDAEAPALDLDHERFLLDNPDEHRHPHQEEVLEVLAGEYAVEYDGEEHRLSEGESITVPENTAHRHWNPTGQPVRVAQEHHPPRDSAAYAETMWALAQDGETDEKGMPNLLQFAVISAAYPGIVYTTAVPLPVQKVAIAVLAPLGRVAGYSAEYTSEE